MFFSLNIFSLPFIVFMMKGNEFIFFKQYYALFKKSKLKSFEFA